MSHGRANVYNVDCGFFARHICWDVGLIGFEVLINSDDSDVHMVAQWPRKERARRSLAFQATKREARR